MEDLFYRAQDTLCYHTVYLKRALSHRYRDTDKDYEDSE